jgi:hypothetical protein
VEAVTGQPSLMPRWRAYAGVDIDELPGDLDHVDDTWHAAAARLNDYLAAARLSEVDCPTCFGELTEVKDLLVTATPDEPFRGNAGGNQFVLEEVR